MATMAQLPDFAGRTSRSARGAGLRVGATLHGRVILAAFAALAFSLAVGAGALLWDARRSVSVELTAARSSAVQAARADLAAATGPDALPGVIRTFNGSRHVRAVLLDAGGARVMASTPFAPRTRPPGWFVRLVDPHAAPESLATADAARPAILLVPDPENEIGEAWAGVRDALLIVALLSVVAIFLIRRAVQRALRPLGALSEALARVGAGDFEARVQPGETVELAALTAGFNAMAGQLDAIDRENRRLHEQLLTVQEEERAELARDLHDEIGPYLFAVNIDAAAVRDLARAGKAAAIPERAGLIQTAVGHMQTQVVEMLGRLRPLRAVEFGLAPAVEDLVAFWRTRRPDIAFELAVALDDAALGLGVREALYRVVQEALSNAVRHGAPTRISVTLGACASGGVRARVADNGAGGGGSATRPRFGLVGMRERIAGLGGSLAIEPGAAGWSVIAEVPDARIGASS